MSEKNTIKQIYLKYNVLNPEENMRNEYSSGIMKKFTTVNRNIMLSQIKIGFESGSNTGKRPPIFLIA